MSETIKEFDCVMLADGREVVVLDVLANGKAYVVEVSDDNGDVVDTPIIERRDVMRVTYRHQG